MLLAWGVSLLPLYFVGGLLAVAATAILFTSATPQRRHFGRPTIIACLVYAVLFWLVIATFTGVKREMTYDMEWSLGESVEYLPDCQHVVLRFKDYPSYSVGIYSNDLADYLQTLAHKDVRVTFAMTLDFGRTRGFHETRIGELTDWNAVDGYFSSRGDGSKSPFP